MSGAKVGGYVNIGGCQTNVHKVVGTGAPLPLGKWTSVALTYDGEPVSLSASATSAWERTATPGNRYQNGAYWHMPVG